MAKRKDILNVALKALLSGFETSAFLKIPAAFISELASLPEDERNALGVASAERLAELLTQSELSTTNAALAAVGTEQIKVLVSNLTRLSVEQLDALKKLTQLEKSTSISQDDLQIHVNSTRDSQRQLAQICVLNTRQRPILLDAWFVMWTDKSMSVSACCKRGVLPVRLQDHERAELLVDISDHPVEQLEGLGVVDAEQRCWHTNAKELRQFIHVARLHQPPKIDPPTDESNL